MPRKKVEKKVTKKVVKEEKKVKTVKAPKALKASPFEESLKEILLNILSLFSASLLDAFRQYVETKMFVSKPASLEEFKSGYSNTVAVQGISDEKLLEALNPVQLEYLSNSFKQPALETKVQTTESVPEKQESTESSEEKSDKSVFDSLDLI